MRVICTLAVLASASAFVAREAHSTGALAKTLKIRGGDLGGWREKADSGKNRLENKADEGSNKAQDFTRRAESEVRGRASDAKGKVEQVGRRIEDSANNIIPEQAIPMASAIPGILLGLNLIFSPERASDLLAINKGSITDGSDNRYNAAIGAAILLANGAVAVTASKKTHDSLKLSNTLALVTSVITEGFVMYGQRNGTGSESQGLKGWRLVRGVVAAGTIWALASLSGNTN